MKITIPYGDRSVSFDVPRDNFCEVLSPKEVVGTNDYAKVIEEALDNPIGSKKLEEIVKPNQTVSILCDDMSRPTPAHVILPIMLKRLHSAGIKKEDIKIIMALGSHRYMTQEEMIAKVGSYVYENYKVINSSFKDKNSLVDMGKAPDGTRIFATKDAVESDIRIGLGNIVPHPVMGWSGGGKILYPGIAGEETVALFHIMGGLLDENLFGNENSPVRLTVEEWVDVIGLHFIVNTVLTSEFNVHKVVAGDYVKAQRAGVQAAKEVWGVQTTKKADIMIVSSHPADQDFWQSGKGLYSAENGLIKKGGTIILVSPNYEGVGPHPEFPQYMGRDDAHEILEKVQKDETIKGDRLAISVGTAMSKMRKRREIIMVSDGVTKNEVESCGIKYYPLNELQKAIDETIKKYDHPLISAITHGGELYVY